MAERKPKNIPASVQARLLNRRVRTGENYDNLLRRYAVEGFLRRLALSRHRERFILKGAMLFVVWGLEEHRSTRDVDFLGFGAMSLDVVIETMKEIISADGCEDGLAFLADSIEADLIRRENVYGGTRVSMTAMLPPARISLQIDIGAGDAGSGFPLHEFPPLLEATGPVVRVYPKEVSIAEKYHAIVELDMKNSRLKDFYDIWALSNHFEFDLRLLTETVRETFERRNRKLPAATPVGITETFSNDPGKRLQWNAFLRKTGIITPVPDFAAVLSRIGGLLEPVRQEVLVPSQRHARWNPALGDWCPPSPP